MGVTHLAGPPLPTAALEDAAAPTRALLGAGDRIEVRRRLDDKWARGFEVIDGDDGGYRVRRQSDGVEIPVRFAAVDVRKERKRDYWWY